MDSNLKQIISEIERGHNPEMNLPRYFSRLSTLYEQYAEVVFTLDYYSFYDNYIEMEKEGALKEEEEQFAAQLNQIVAASVLSGFSGEKMEENIKALDALRNRIIDRMEILTAYTDIFIIYDHIMTRLEYRFKDVKDDFDDEGLAVKILNYIFEYEDNLIINERVKEIIGELPVRMTKPRYFDLIRESLSLYKGAVISSVDSYLYMIRSSAMLHIPEGMDTAYPEFREFREKLKNLDFRNVTAEEYNTLHTELISATEKISNSVDFYYSLQETINHLYVINLMTPYAFTDAGSDSDKELCIQIIRDIYEHFQADVHAEMDVASADKLISTEGKQESLFHQITAAVPVLEVIKSEYGGIVDSLMLGRTFRCLEAAEKLIGSSLFAVLEQAAEDKKADDAYIGVVQEELITQLTQVFAGSSKYIYRSIVANTINKMPVFFQSPEEIREYIMNSLEQCRDLPEKSASVDIIGGFLKN